MTSVFKTFSNFTDRLLKRLFPRLYAHVIKDDKLARFLVSSMVVGLTSIVFLFIFYDLVKLSLELSTALAFILAFFVSFFIHRGWTFGTRRQGVSKQMIAYFFNTLIILSLNIILVQWLTNFFGVWHLLSQLIANVTLGLYNFLMSKFVIFKNKDNEANNQ
ncbi:MAG: GtrA family protein [Candidatus Parcubacteria bacterium]|nr:MAG: GtrA family protein [Candidatus Parcubacteria bacterium]